MCIYSSISSYNILHTMYIYMYIYNIFISIWQADFQYKDVASRWGALARRVNRPGKARSLRKGA